MPFWQILGRLAVSSDGTTYTRMGSTAVGSDGSMFTQMGSTATGLGAVFNKPDDLTNLKADNLA